MSTMTASAKLAAFNAAQETKTLVAAMMRLDPIQHKDAAHGIALRSIFAELEDRHPEAYDLMGTWFEDESPEGLEFITGQSYASLLMLTLDQTNAI